MPGQNMQREEDGQQNSVREHAPRRFTTRLHHLYLALATAIEGIENTSTRKRYAALLIYRLMFIYFLQHLSPRAGDSDYLQSRLREQRGHNNNFYRNILRPLFIGEEKHSHFPRSIVKLFNNHEIEHQYSAIEIVNEPFTRLFALFDEYTWQVCERIPRAGRTVTPEILGILFEQDLHSKEMGIYYTPGDVTTYVVRNTLLAALFTRTGERCSRGSLLEPLLWHTLVSEPLRYIYAAARKGYTYPLPPEIAAGLEDITQRVIWQQQAPALYAHPGETWREVVARREQVDEILTFVRQDTPVTLDRLITWNMDLPLLTLQTLRACQQSELLAAFYQSLRQLSVLDPTCGSGAFLCATLPLLQDLYTACLTRMEALCADHDESSLPPDLLHSFRTYLEEGGAPSMRTQASLQWIISHNLYGVDLNEEAIEVCRLRLCLQLIVAQPDHRQVTLPDDFGQHIRAGNSLLGSLSSDYTLQNAQESPEVTHQRRAFHWHQAFPAPMERGGFDVVIGNPPYVEYKRVRQFYTLDGYTTLETGNLYALTMERAAHLLVPGGRCGMIVPSSATCADGYHALQKLLLAQNELHIASFSDQRGHLLALSHPRLCIIFYTRATSVPARQSKVFATPYIKLGGESRASLFERLSYTEVTPQIRSGLIPRYGSPLELAISNKLACQDRVLGAYAQRTGAYPIYFTRKLSWYVQVTPFIPHILDAQSQVRSPSELKDLRFSSSSHARMAFVALNSNLFYWLITTASDCRNLNMREVRGLPLDLASIRPALEQELCHLADKLESDLLLHACMRSMVFQSHGRMTIQCLYPARSKHLIDEIDCVLAHHYAFDARELDFLLHYDEKYRRNV